MVSWFLIIILAYLFFSFASFGDKLVLQRSKNPKLYVFYVGSLSLLALILVPFADFSLPDSTSLFWIILASLVFISGLYALYSAVEKFEVSRVVPIVGALQPIFILFLSWAFFGFSIMGTGNFLAFFILLAAGAIIAFEKKFELTKSLLSLSLSSSFLIASSFIFLKMVFIGQPFLNGIIWVGIFNFLFALTFLLDPNFKKELFTQKSALNKKTVLLVVLTQSAGGLAGILQNLAIYLAPVSSLAIINALRGVQYVFLFLITLIFSYLFPKILKEEVSIRTIIQKSISIFLIAVGLAILVLK